MNGRFCACCEVSCVLTERTTEFSIWMINLHTWHDGFSQSAAFLLAKSDRMLAEPARCRKSTWYRLAVDRNDVTRGLAENSPRHNLSIACTQGLLSVRTHVRWVNCIIYALKCFTAAAIHSASISHGSHVT